MCNLQTVSFVKLAQGFEGHTIYESNHRRIQRFFADFIIDRHMVSQQSPTGVRHNMFLQILKTESRISGYLYIFSFVLGHANHLKQPFAPHNA